LRLAGAFFLRVSKTGRNLIPMVASGLNCSFAAAVAGFTARFKPSLLAMPWNRSRSFSLPPDQGTADTLLLR
jgi:hypothetical protein